MYEIIGIWVGAFFTLAIYSFLYKENPVYRLAEHLVVGISLGYTMAITYDVVLKPRLIEPLLAGGSWILLIPALLGLLYITRFISSIAWLSRYPIAFVLGTGMGVGFPLTMKSNVLRQLEAAMIPFYQEGMPWHMVLGNVVLVLGTLAALIYFFFSKPHKGFFFGTGSRIGIWIIMLGFGATFGFTVMGRISLLIGRIQYLLGDWLHLIE
ncbi:MAG: hypothetical protein AVO35_01025 [Candidatus Aegiribacteria sp. MLS_C]|nr:MAG: hypothetical protein AVO35_01025 [Candidatus Aegiribacteria sp. MLS_C]